MKIAVFLPNWIGDAVMATPVLTALRNDFPAAEIVGVMRPVIADVLADSGLVDRYLLYNPRGKSPEQKGWRFAARLRREKCDTVLLLPNSLRSGLLGWWSGAKRRIGFSRDGRGWLLTEGVAPASRSIPNPVIDEYLRLAKQFGCQSGSRKMTLAVSESAAAAVATFRQRHWGESASYVALNTGGAFGPAKNWPRESFVELARRIVETEHRRVLVVCGPAEKEDAAWIARQCQRKEVVSLADESLSVGLTKAAIAAAELLVTTDSGPRHFATAFGVPVVTLFGPTHIAWSETFDPKAVHLQIAVDCGPCQQRVCPAGHHRCMKELSVDTVWQAVRQQLGRSGCHVTASPRVA